MNKHIMKTVFLLGCACAILLLGNGCWLLKAKFRACD